MNLYAGTAPPASPKTLWNCEAMTPSMDMFADWCSPSRHCRNSSSSWPGGRLYRTVRRNILTLLAHAQQVHGERVLGDAQEAEEGTGHEKRQETSGHGPVHRSEPQGFELSAVVD